MIAEVKNKWNTTKGDHKVRIYDNIDNLLKTNEYRGYTGYYVEVLPKDRKMYNIPFTPSDNVAKTRRPLNEKIRIIDGKSFYALATGEDDAIKQLYKALPNVLDDIIENNSLDISKDPMFQLLIDKAFT